MARRKTIKRILLGVVIFFVLIIGFLAAAPFLFQDKIIAAVKKGVNENLNAKVDFKDVDISLLRRFPNVSVRIEDYEVMGVEEFEGVKLAGGDAFDITVDFWSAWNFGKEPLKIRSVTLDRPDVNVIVLKNGKANYDIAKPSPDTAAAAQFDIQLQKYEINNARLVYDDRQGGIYVLAENLNHSGKGDFTQDVYDLQTKTTIDSLTAVSGGVEYLTKVKTSLDAGINVNMPEQKFTLKENTLKLNEMVVNADGYLALPNENDVVMDLTFNAPQNNFKNLLSLVPNAYTQGFEDVKTSGEYKFNGMVKGTYSAEPERYPAFKVKLDVSNGDVKYPNMPLGISDINTNVEINSASSNLDEMVVDISRFRLKIGSNPLEGYFKLRTPISDPDIDTKINGVLNLDELSKAFPMEGVQQLNGTIIADVTAKTKMSTIDKGDYNNVLMNGAASVKNMNYVAADLPPVKINSLEMNFTPQNVQVPAFDMNLGKSNLSGNGRVDNILAFFSPDATMKGAFTVRSNYFNADEWVTEESNSPQSTVVNSQSVATTSGTEEEMFNRFDFTLDAAVNKMDYDVYKLTNLVARGNFTPNILTISQVSGKIGDSDFAASGTVTNVWNYLFENETLGGNITLRSNYLNLNQFMTEQPATSQTQAAPAAAAEPILVPANINMTVDAAADKVLYTDLELNNVRGRLTVANEEMKFQDFSASTLGGSMNITGGYSTQIHDKPKFDLGLELANMDFQKSFNQFNTFKALAPVAKFIQGKFDTKLTISSFLKPDLTPDFTTLDAAGFLHTLDAAVRHYKPLEKIGEKLNVDALKDLTIKNTKNWFTVKNGAVEVEEFTHTFEDIAMRIGGMHKINGEMNYNIVAKIPREKIGKNPLGAAANTGLDFLSKEASKLGLNLNAGEFVNVQINLTGTIADPKISFKLLGSEGTASVKEAVVGKIEQEAQKQLDEAKAKAEQQLQEEKKKLEEEATRKAEEAKKKLEEEAKKKLEEETKKRLEEEKRKKLEEEAKKKLEELNPLKKKKGGG